MPNVLFQMRSLRLPVSPASLPEIPHDQAQGRGRLGVCVPDMREAFREGPQPERAHVDGAPADPGGGPEKQRPAAAPLRLANHHAERRGGPPGPGEVTAEHPGLQPGDAKRTFLTLVASQREAVVETDPPEDQRSSLWPHAHILADACGTRWVSGSLGFNKDCWLGWTTKPQRSVRITWQDHKHKIMLSVLRCKQYSFLLLFLCVAKVIFTWLRFGFQYIL